MGEEMLMDDETGATAAEDEGSTAVATAAPVAVRGTLPASAPNGDPPAALERAPESDRLGDRVRYWRNARHSLSGYQAQWGRAWVSIWTKLHQFWLDESGR